MSAQIKEKPLPDCIREHNQCLEHGHEHVHDNAHEHRHAHTQTRAVVNRLAKAIGHLKSVKTMVEQGKDCSDVLIQLAAVRSALAGTARLILKDHMENCVVDIVESKDTSSLQQLNQAIDMLLK